MSGIRATTVAIKHSAKDAGFDLAGIAAVRDFPELAYFHGGSLTDTPAR